MQPTVGTALLRLNCEMSTPICCPRWNDTLDTTNSGYGELNPIPHILCHTSLIANGIVSGDDPLSGRGRISSGSSRNYSHRQGSAREPSCERSCTRNTSDTGSSASKLPSFAFWKEIGQNVRSDRKITHDLEVEMTIWILYCI